MSRHVSLPSAITTARYDEFDQVVANGIAGLVRSAGLRTRRSKAGDISVASDPHSPLLYLKPLQNSDGRFRADAGRSLSSDAFAGDLSGAVSKVMSQLPPVANSLTAWNTLQLEMMRRRDSLEALKELVEVRPMLRFYRIGANQRCLLRFGFWKLLQKAVDGVGATDLSFIPQPGESAIVEGLVAAAPASFIAPPLVARFQPIAVPLMMNNGAEVIAISKDGLFERIPMHDSWPTGAPTTRLRGSGKGVYKTDIKTVGTGFALELMQPVIDGASRLLHLVTDPATFAEINGQIDLDEHWIQWSSIQFGLDAINSMGANWDDRNAIWNAFRALGTLQGIWEGSRGGSVPLWELLTPSRLRSTPLPHLPGRHQTFYRGLIDNYEQAITAAFPRKSEDATAQAVQELRHLVHGVGGQGKRPRDVRLDVLRDLGRRQVNIQLVCDMATLWWTALLLSPEKLFTPGRRPW